MKTRIDSLLIWLKQASDQQIKATGTTRAYLRLIGYGHKTASVETAALVERATDGRATRKQLRPKDWMVMWPELVDQPSSSDSQVTSQPHCETAH
ncbi:hypothetical protein [Salinicola halophyticus]|uniref:hypothetical protein n=1 Tax=Salinicola halophyticus TaxID=1808881 RepID=UPI000DA16EBA|nr:hypothetical protein [Salinicola halophyticus]